MNYNIKGTEIEITDELRSYAEKKLAAAEKFLQGDPTAHADVECEYAPGRDGVKYRAEFTVSASGEVYRAHEWANTMHEALDAAAGNLSRELRRDKKKRQHVLRRAASRVKEYVRGWRDSV